MTDHAPDIFDLAYLASEFKSAVEKKAKLNLSLNDAFIKAVTPQELEEIQIISDILHQAIANEQGGNDDAVQAPRAALVVQVAEYYAAISSRVMKEDEVSLMVPKERRTQIVSDLFSAHKAPNLAKLFKPV